MRRISFKSTGIHTVENIFLTCETVSFIFIGDGKICLAHGLNQLTRDTASDVSCLQMSLACLDEKL